MAQTKYTFSISSDFPNHKVDLDLLTYEIRNSNIITSLDYISTAGNNCDIWFKNALSGGDQTILNNIVDTHSGNPTATKDLAIDEDGKQFVVAFPSKIKWETMYIGVGDNIAEQERGGGPRIRLAWDNVEARGEKHVDLRFVEPVEIHDGQAFYSPVANWNMDDLFSIMALIPSASTTTASPANTGNCSWIDTGQGYSVLAPADGDGTDEVDLTTVAPIVTKNNDGLWEYNQSTGEVFPATNPGAGNCNILNIPITSYIIRKVPLGNPLGVFDVESYKAQWVHQNWSIRVSVDKQSPGAGDFAGWFMVFRENST